MVNKIAPNNRSIRTIGTPMPPIGMLVKIKLSHQSAMGIKASFTLSSIPWAHKEELVVRQKSVIKKAFKFLIIFFMRMNSLIRRIAQSCRKKMPIVRKELLNDRM